MFFIWSLHHDCMKLTVGSHTRKTWFGQQQGLLLLFFHSIYSYLHTLWFSYGDWIVKQDRWCLQTTATTINNFGASFQISSRRHCLITPNRFYRKTAKSIFVLFPILGVPWLIGFLINTQSPTINLVFQYIHVVFNGLQGFFIFLLYCVVNREVTH